MEDKILEKRILEQKETAKKVIEDSKSFILLTNEDMVGCASMLDTCHIVFNSLRTMFQEGVLPKYLLNDFIGFISADDANEYIKNRTIEIMEESEE